MANSAEITPNFFVVLYKAVSHLGWIAPLKFYWYYIVSKKLCVNLQKQRREEGSLVSFVAFLVTPFHVMNECCVGTSAIYKLYVYFVFLYGCYGKVFTEAGESLRHSFIT